MQFTTAEITAWVGALLWPFIRIGAMLIAAPLFGAGAVTVRIRLGLAFMLAVLVAPLIPTPPAVEPLSFNGLMIAVQQVLIGVVLGFLIQMVFSALNQAGENIARSMGLGFASMVDPQQGVQVPALSSYLVMMTTLMFVALGGHIALIELTLVSFHTLPISPDGLTREDFWNLVNWGSVMYMYSLLVALPAVTSLLVVSIALGVISKAAPQLNIFAVGFPVKIMLGFILLILTLPVLLVQFTDLLTEAFEFMSQITEQ
jgi:flagellar biosynthetic protein FliR